ncbi:GIY-YIG nuclease family protein [Candidatus Saccharibacteria bacterium]|nr:GIY-YIG nuclease family protein [Candidatus Saccharibacteria bacterium]
MKSYYVYILTNRTNQIFYIGITNDLWRRIYEHKNHLVTGFTDKYNLEKLVYYEETSDVNSAIQREKQLKNWHRQWKINLIEQANPNYKDLAEEL